MLGRALLLAALAASPDEGEADAEASTVPAASDGAATAPVPAPEPAPGAGALETVVRGTRGSVTSLSEGELQQIPGTMGDPIRGVLSMPGVSTMFSGVSYPIVRGSGPASTGFFVDGVPVPLLFHLFVGPSVIHPDFIGGLELRTSAPGPEHGRLLGGVVEVKTKEPSLDRLRASAYLDVIDAGAFASAPLPAGGGSVAIAGRFSFTAWLIALLANATHTVVAPDQPRDASAVLAFSDYQLRVDQPLGPGTLRLLAFGSWDDYGVDAQLLQDGYLIHAGFHRADLRYLWPLGPGEAEVALTAGVDRLGYDGPNGSGVLELGPLGWFQVTTVSESVTEPSFRARASWRGRPSPGVQLSLGADADHRSARLFAHQLLEPRSIVEPFPQRLTGETLERDLTAEAAVGTFVGAWAQVGWTGLGPWEISSGLRVDNYHLRPGIDRTAFEPRISARRRISDQLTLRVATGAVHQPPVALIGLPVVDVGGLRYGLQEAVHAGAGVDWRPFRGLDVSVDAYFNPVLRAVDLDIFGSGAMGFEIAGPTGASLFPEVAAVTSRGYATGLEVMVRHPLGDRWFGWLTYSLQRSMRWTTYDLYDLTTGRPKGEESGWVPFAFDQTHVANATLGYSFPGGWTAGVSLHFNTGRPESGQLTSRTQTIGESEFGRRFWVLVDDAHVARLPPFFRVDARVSKVWTLGPIRLEASLDVLNATLNAEVVKYEYDPFELARRPTTVPLVLPVLGVKGSL